MLSKSRFNGRLHRTKPMFITLFEILGESFVQLNKQKRYAVDTIPIVVVTIFAFVAQKFTPMKHFEAISRRNVGISTA